MTITILSEKIVNDFDTGQPVSRTVVIAIDNTYEWPVGGLPLVGDLQPILEANEALYLAAAQAKNSLLPQDSADQLGAKGWFKANPAAANLFVLPVADLETQVVALIEASFPSLSAGDKNKWRLLLMALALSVRVFARRLGLLD